jgi:hypothetical protein
LRSNYFRKLDLTADGTYSSGNSKLLNYNDLFDGLISRTNNTLYQVTGPAKTDRISSNADLGLTYHISKRWSVSDKFRWLYWRDPGIADFLTTNCYSNLLTNTFSSPTSGLSPSLSTATGNPCAIAGLFGVTPVGNAPAFFPTIPGTSPAAAVQAVAYNTLEGEQTFFNTITLNWDPSRRFSGFIGYRYGRRELKSEYLALTTNSPVIAGGLVGPAGAPSTSSLLSNTNINQHTALVGIIARPTDKWRIRADTEILYADNAFTQIAPRHQQRVRASTVYKLNRWASLNGSVHFIETSNSWAESFGGNGVNLFPASDFPAYGTKSHDRYYSLGASLNPNRRVTIDVGWSYMNQLYNIPACMVLTGASVVAGGAPAVCPNTTNQPTVPATFNITSSQFNVPVIQSYQENTHTGYAYLILRPVRRVTMNVGYQITSTGGHNNWLRADTGLPLEVVADIYGNSPAIVGNPTSPCPAASTAVTGGCAFLGPFPDQPLGALASRWHKATAGLTIAVAKGIAVKGAYAYYDYAENDNVGLPVVTLPRNFHTSMGTVSVKYSF